MATEVTTRFLADSEYEHWAALVGAAPAGSVYSLPHYLLALCAATDARLRVLVAEHDGRIIGGIGLYERRNRGGTCVSPRRLLYYNGLVLVAHASTYPAQRTAWDLRTMAALERRLVALGYARLRIKTRAPAVDARVFMNRGWTATPIYSYVVDITDLDRAWQCTDKNLRRLINRCKDQDLTVTIDDDFDAFHRLHRQTHERKDAPLYLAHDPFKTFVKRLQAHGLCRLYHARLAQGTVVASQLVLTGPHPVTHTVCAAADAEFLRLGASAFLRWKVFEDLAHAGYQANDLTDAELNPVTQFKSQLGGDLTLCLELSRPDSLRWRANEQLASAPQRARRALSRALKRVAPGRP